MNNLGNYLRDSQKEILNFNNGKMGISAVPGSGKTWTLSLLAANLIVNNNLKDGQEVLIVTLVNSAVENFSQRISKHLISSGLLPDYGYRVRTLHGLAHDIVRERPEIVGVSNDFNIIDEKESLLIISEASKNYIKENTSFINQYLIDNLDQKRIEQIKRKSLPDMVESLAISFIRSLKDSLLTNEEIIELMRQCKGVFPLADLGFKIFLDYQQSIEKQGAVDFDDLIKYAYLCLKYDPNLVSVLRNRWPYILEDEAQDSSKLQELILSLLTGKEGNWVRVGDPNQAIYETFTTADPKLLRDFIKDPSVKSVNLPESGRSIKSIVDCANFLIDWTKKEHVLIPVRDALSYPLIELTAEDDPQKNPPDNPNEIHLNGTRFTPENEILHIIDDVSNYITKNPDHTIAILVPKNARGYEFIDKLGKYEIPVVDSLLNSTTNTRQAAGSITHILRYLSNPTSPALLSTCYRVWRRDDKLNEGLKQSIDKTVEVIKKCRNIEQYIWPNKNNDWLAKLDDQVIQNGMVGSLNKFRDVVRRWHISAYLPIDQLILTIAQDIFIDPVDLAMAHKISISLKQLTRMHRDWNFDEIINELKIIAKNERKFIGMSDDEMGFDPDKHTGKVVVATLHKAKGLEWDKVYLTSINNYDFPSGMPYDNYFAEKWFIKNNLNLNAEILEQLKMVINFISPGDYHEGYASQKAREEFIKERLRLLYVGITRAKRSMTITYNSGRKSNTMEALPFLALRKFWVNKFEQIK